MSRKLDCSQRARQMSRINTALIAMHLGNVHGDHCHDLVAHFFIAKSLATIVPKHRHLQPYIDRALFDLYDLIGRSKVGVAAITDVELASIDLAAEVFDAMLKTSSVNALTNAIREVDKLLAKQK